MCIPIMSAKRDGFCSAFSLRMNCAGMLSAFCAIICTNLRAMVMHASMLISSSVTRSLISCTRAISNGRKRIMSSSIARAKPPTVTLSIWVGIFTTLITLAIVPTIYISFMTGSSTFSSRCATSIIGSFSANAFSTAARDCGLPTSNRAGSPGNMTRSRNDTMGNISVPSTCRPNSDFSCSSSPSNTSAPT